MIIAVLFFMTGALVVFSGIVLSVLLDIRSATTLQASKQSHAIAEGGMEDALYRVMNGVDIDDTEVLAASTTPAAPVATTSITDLVGGKDLLSRGDSGSRIRKVRTIITEESGISFNYGIQSDTGGIVMENSSSVLGNVYSNGSVTGSDNDVFGDVISAGPAGHIDGIHATGSAWAHTIENSHIEKDAYYTSIDGATIVDGTEYPGSADQPTSSLPITDATIEQWKQEAQDGGEITTCPHVIDSDGVLGPVKIACDTEIRKQPTIDVAGPVWIEGDLTLINSPKIRVDASLSDKSVPIVVDNPADRLTSSQVLLRNSSEFDGNGSNSYILIVSQNESAKEGGAEAAITLENGADGELLVFAGKGEILLQNNVDLREVSSYRIRLQNSAQVIYETGVSNPVFTSGPSGGFVIDSWREVE